MKRFLSTLLVCTLLLAANCVGVFAEEEPANVSELSKYGIMNGDPDGNMRLPDTLTRAEAIALMVRLYRFDLVESDLGENSDYSNITNHWAYREILTAEKFEIIDAIDKENFNPDESIPAEEFIKMIICLLGYQEVAEQRGGNPNGYFIQSSQLGVTKGVPMDLGNYITRENAVQILCNSLDVPIMVMTAFDIEESNRYIIMNGKNGEEYCSIRTLFEEK